MEKHTHKGDSSWRACVMHCCSCCCTPTNGLSLAVPRKLSVIQLVDEDEPFVGGVETGGGGGGGAGGGPSGARDMMFPFFLPSFFLLFQLISKWFSSEWFFHLFFLFFFFLILNKDMRERELDCTRYTHSHTTPRGIEKERERRREREMKKRNEKHAPSWLSLVATRLILIRSDSHVVGVNTTASHCIAQFPLPSFLFCYNITHRYCTSSPSLPHAPSHHIASQQQRIQIKHWVQIRDHKCRSKKTFILRTLCFPIVFW